MNKIYEICDRAKDLEYYTCSQLVQYIEDKENKDRPKTIHEIAERFLRAKKASSSEGTIHLYELALKYFMEFLGSDYLIERLTSDDLHAFRLFLREEKQLSTSTISIKERNLHTFINYAIKSKYVTFDVSPYNLFTDTPPTIRKCDITIEQLRKVRDCDLTGRKDFMTQYARDLFMLSFYLCGMNLVDIMNNDLTGTKVCYSRIKTKSRKRFERDTIFTIQPEARVLIDRLIKDGKIVLKYERTYDAVSRIIYDALPRIAKLCGIDTRFIFYSARKTFAQIANNLNIKDNIIEYCIGDAESKPHSAIGYYRTVTPELADLAIRKVFDAVASDKSLEELTKDSFKL